MHWLPEKFAVGALLCGIACFLVVRLVPEALGQEVAYESPNAILPGRDGKCLYVAEEGAKRIAVMDASSHKPAASWKVPFAPRGLALSPNGSLLFTVGGDADGEVLWIDTKSGEPRGSIRVGHTPMAPTLSPDGKTLYVCLRFQNEVAVIDISSKRIQRRIPVTREPVAEVLSKDGKTLFVANHLPSGPANVNRISSVVDVIDTAKCKVVKSIPLSNGAVALRRICLSPDGKIVYVTSTFAKFMLATTAVERGWMNSSGLSLIDAEKRELLYSICLDDESLGAANPWGVVCSPDGKWICVAHAGTHEVSIIDQAALLAKLSKFPALGQSGLADADYEALPDNPTDDLNFLQGIRRRIKLKGIGPRELTAANGKLYAANYFSGTVDVVDLESGKVLEPIRLGPDQPMTLERKGEMLFNDASQMCFQQWQSCATCHPDGRMDGLNWDLLNDGMGNPKSTRSLLFAAETAPLMAKGVRHDAERAVRSGIKYIQFMQPTDEKTQAILAYIKSMKPVPSPFLVNGQLSSRAQKGKQVFEKAECASCHNGLYFTDSARYNVGTSDSPDKGAEFVTTKLNELWRTAPYLHDGRSATLEDVLGKDNPRDQHGVTSKLTPEERANLVEYLKSL